MTWWCARGGHRWRKKEVRMRRRLSQRLQTSTLMLGYRHSVRGHYTPHCWCVFTCRPPQGACSVGPWTKHQPQTPTYCTKLLLPSAEHQFLHFPVLISHCLALHDRIFRSRKRKYATKSFWTFLPSASIWGCQAPFRKSDRGGTSYLSLLTSSSS